MNEYLYEEQLKNERFEMLINTKDVLTQEEADFILSWDPTEHENIIYVRDDVFLNLNIYSEHDHEKRNEDDANNPQITRMNEQLDELLGPKDMPGFEGTWGKLNDLCNV